MEGRNRIGVVRALAVGLLLAVAGCDSSLTGPSTTPDFSQTDLLEGTGAEAAAGKLLTVEYTAWLYENSQVDLKGLQFDSSRGREPFVFTLGASQVIPGWDLGIVGMKAGGVRKLVVPPELAYGGTRRGPIPPNTALVFEIELLAVE